MGEDEGTKGGDNEKDGWGRCGGRDGKDEGDREKDREDREGRGGERGENNILYLANVCYLTSKN